jgi:hypothetical protein
MVVASTPGRVKKRANVQPIMFRLAVCVFLSFALVAGRITGAELLSTAPKATRQAQVIVVQNSGATRVFEPQPEVVQSMVDRALIALTGRTNAAAAWGSLISTQDVVGIKVYSAPGPMTGTHPAVVEAIVRGLLAAQLPSQHIVVWDRRLADLRQSGFAELAGRHGVRLAGSLDAGYDETVFYDTALLGNLRWSDLEFGRKEESIGRKSYVSKLVSRELTKIINVTPLLNHNDAGVAGNLYGLALGSVDNTRRFETDTGLMTRAVPEIYALPALGDRVVLNIVDALICQYEGGQYVRLHNASVLNEIRVSRDPVALDVLSVQELARQRQLAGFPTVRTNGWELFQNASLLELGINDLQKIQTDRLP